MNNKTEITTFDFESLSYKILPGVKHYHCAKHNIDLTYTHPFKTDVGTINDNVHIKDICVEENRHFNYHIVKPIDSKSTKKITFLFHGFNEKDWNKYLPWANEICEGTGSSVILFPMAFHMQRAPKHWSDKREMFKLSSKRKKRYPNVVDSSLSNVAISMRLHAKPQRFIWSGLQTYYDVIQLIETCKKGEHPYINEDFEFNIFAYSIGGLLAQILKMTNYKNYFTNSKVCLFCGGAVFNRLSPVSKFILDSEANISLYSFLIEHFDKILQKEEVLRHYIQEDHLEGKVFHSILDFQKMRDFRESLLRKYEKQIYAIALKKDSVIPSFEVINTLKGAYRDINIRVDEIDFNRDYTHVNPFSDKGNFTQQVNDDLKLVFNRVIDFFKE